LPSCLHERPPLGIPSKVSACKSAMTSAYFDVEFRATLDEISFQRLITRFPHIEPWGKLDKVPQSILNDIERSPCFFTVANTAAPVYTARVIYVWCAKHRRVERLTLRYNTIISLSLFRHKGHQFFNTVLNPENESSHTCHNTSCENPYHLSYEPHSVNIGRIPCGWSALRRLQKTMSTEAAIAQIRARCEHSPRCWPATSTIGVTPEQVTDSLVRVCSCS